jgi:hypothetical protein
VIKIRSTAMSRRAAIGLALAGCLSPARVLASAGVKLIMVDDPNCRYCRLFDKEISGLYPKTDEGRYAPLVRVRRKSPELRGLNPVIYTPTFVLVRNGEELGRITGYPGPEFFFSELRVLLGRTGFTGRTNSYSRDK